MSRTVNIHEAKTHLSRLVEEVAATGEEVVIAKAGRPVARITALQPAERRKKLGQLKGRIRIPADFDAPLPRDLLSGFEDR